MKGVVFASLFHAVRTLSGLFGTVGDVLATYHSAFCNRQGTWLLMDKSMDSPAAGVLNSGTASKSMEARTLQQMVFSVMRFSYGRPDLAAGHFMKWLK